MYFSQKNFTVCRYFKSPILKIRGAGRGKPPALGDFGKFVTKIGGRQAKTSKNVS